MCLVSSLQQIRWHNILKPFIGNGQRLGNYGLDLSQAHRLLVGCNITCAYRHLATSPEEESPASTLG